jgi:hypothetical protein
MRAVKKNKKWQPVLIIGKYLYSVCIFSKPFTPIISAHGVGSGGQLSDAKV